MIRSGSTAEIRSLNLKEMSMDKINARDISRQVQKNISQELVSEIVKIHV
jgi:hypothetical protein